MKVTLTVDITDESNDQCMASGEAEVKLPEYLENRLSAETDKMGYPLQINFKHVREALGHLIKDFSA